MSPRWVRELVDRGCLPMAFADSHPNRAKRRIRASADTTWDARALRRRMEIRSWWPIRWLFNSPASAEKENGKDPGAKREHEPDYERLFVVVHDAAKSGPKPAHHQDDRGPEGEISHGSPFNRLEFKSLPRGSVEGATRVHRRGVPSQFDRD